MIGSVVEKKEIQQSAKKSNAPVKRTLKSADQLFLSGHRYRGALR